MPGDKTEEPTAKHLRDAREQGQVVKSNEIPTTAVVLAAFMYIWLRFDAIVEKISTLMGNCVASMGEPFFQVLGARVREACLLFVELALPCVLFAALAGVIGHLAQTGLMTAWKAATPSLDKLNPTQWFKKVFSIKNLVEFLKSVVKIGVVVFVFYTMFASALPLLVRLPGRGLMAVRAALGVIMWDVFLYTGVAFVAIAALDWLFQRWQFMKEHRMSKEDVKNEYKQQEGDPHIKGQRKQLHQEMVMNDQAMAVKHADVLVTNPTHYAIAIEYKAEKARLPIIIAKGQGGLAERMIKIAEQEGIPIMRNVPLAHDLWEQGEELQYIPSTLLEPVAEVLRWLRDIKEQGGGQ